MKRETKTETVSHRRLLDCMHYSRCLMQAAKASSKRFSCSMCESYKPEKVTDEDRVLETIRALKFFDVLLKGFKAQFVTE